MAKTGLAIDSAAPAVGCRRSLVSNARQLGETRWRDFNSEFVGTGRN